MVLPINEPAALLAGLVGFDEGLPVPDVDSLGPVVVTVLLLAPVPVGLADSDAVPVAEPVGLAVPVAEPVELLELPPLTAFSYLSTTYLAAASKSVMK